MVRTQKAATPALNVSLRAPATRPALSDAFGLPRLSTSIKGLTAVLKSRSIRSVRETADVFDLLSAGGPFPQRSSPKPCVNFDVRGMLRYIPGLSEASAVRLHPSIGEAAVLPVSAADLRA